MVWSRDRESSVASSSRQPSLGLVKLDADVGAIDTLNHALDDVAFGLRVLAEDLIALCLADALQDDLLGRLRCDASEVVGGHIDANHTAQDGQRVHRARLFQGHLDPVVAHLLHNFLFGKDTRLPVGRFNVDGNMLRSGFGRLLVRRDERSLQGLTNHFARQIALGCEMLDGDRQIVFRCTCHSQDYAPPSRAGPWVAPNSPLQQEKWGHPTFQRTAQGRLNRLRV